MAELRVVSGTLRGKSLKLPPGLPIDVGSDPGASLRICEDGVSPHHALFLLSGDSLIVADYGSEHGTWPNIYYLMLPVVIGLQVLFTIGVALLVSTLGLFFQDTANIVGHILRMWYFMSPGLYSIDLVPREYQALFRLNPFCELMTSYRDILMRGRMPDWYDLGYAFGIGLFCCMFGYLVFKRYEGRFVQKL